LAVATNSTGVKLGLEESVIIRYLMRLYQMITESLTAVTHLGACAAFRSLLIAPPSFQVKVLRVFVTLPVVLAAKYFVTGQEGAAVRPLVTLHVFSNPLALTRNDVLRARTSVRRDDL